jgi:hypothetical protein
MIGIVWIETLGIEGREYGVASAAAHLQVLGIRAAIDHRQENDDLRVASKLLTRLEPIQAALQRILDALTISIHFSLVAPFRPPERASKQPKPGGLS